MLILPFEPSHFLQNFDWFTVKHALQNTQNDCHQWLSDSSKLHQIRDASGGAYSGPPNILAGLRGPTCNRGKGNEKGGRGGKKREGGKEGERKRGVGREGNMPMIRSTFLNVPTPLIMAVKME